MTSNSPSEKDAGLQHRLRSFSDLKGWEQEDHAEALGVFLQGLSAVRKDPQAGALWAPIYDAAHNCTNARQFFETYFQPTELTNHTPSLVTGYFEPVISGAIEKSADYATPVLMCPQNPTQYSRKDIEHDGALSGLGLELVWLKSWVDLYILQVQGSGRIQLDDGQCCQVSYAGDNGRPYVSIGRELIARGIFEASTITAEAVTKWLLDNPEQGRELTWQNARYIFFEMSGDIQSVDKTPHPCGTLGAPLTPMRSIAVDPQHIPLGLPVWLDKEGVSPLRRLMVAQDTGGAITGPQRADIYYGSGGTAGREASHVNDFGVLTALLPKQLG